ncbi:MAG: outer membrane protein assembly factor BamB [Verrucomicrobiales bacterium]|jgi:outer membrane protein assembly factor BamB
MKTILCLFLFSFLAVAHADNWPEYRGPAGTGHSAEKNLPVTWSDADIAWTTELPGEGQSTPVIWDGRIYLTYAKPAGDKVSRHVVCLSRADGTIVWDKEASVTSGESLHKMNTWATSSCVTDGKLVGVFFGRGGLHVFDVDGTKIWSKDLGEFPGAWGTAGSPVFHGDMLIQNGDAEGASFLYAFNKHDGAPIWKTLRNEKPKGGWSTPIFIKAGDREELVLNGEFGVKGYDPANGKERWFCESFNGRGTPIPAWGNGLLITLNGKPGDLYAVKPGGSGNVTATHRAWNAERGSKARDLASPILVGDVVFTVNMGGFGACFNVTDGERYWVERLGGNHSASPIAANGLVYQLSEEGETVVLRPGKTLDVVARNVLTVEREIFRASPAASEGQLFLRSNRRLFCVGKRGAE